MLPSNLMFHEPDILRQAQQDLAQCKSFVEMKNLLLDLVTQNQDWRMQRCLNLVAAESAMSQLARSLLSSDLSVRMAGGYIGEKNRPFMATGFIDRIESITHILLQTLFKCANCDPRILGGTQACQIVYSALTKPGDTIMAVMPQHGGDSSHTRQSMPAWLQLKVIPIPFLADHTTINLQGLERLVDHYQPTCISLGFSVCLFEQPLAAIQKIAKHYKARVFYDAAHELGLIAGNCFTNPFIHNIDVVSGSTGKTLSGPQGGLLLWDNAEYSKPFNSLIYPDFIGTYPLNRVAALAITALEFLQFGELYMRQVRHNARALAVYLNHFGISVFAKEKNYTETHQVLIEASDYGGGFNAAKRLEKCHIVANHVNLPGDSIALNGLRLATTELTRLGMKSTQMKQVAELIARALLTSEPAQQIQHEVEELTQSFQVMHYCH